ncbi:3-oxoacyl-[acyl-carrier-protein] reductase FabG [Bacteroidaceae bacterium]|uniref:SDR family NAD(P)-dependent oxidoreductase n=1 Tax=uncultured Phocaeicola sp. TaxID=990718 RepID=UPI0014336F4B|nr:SDR family oxidoreductase [uncultured Phocaeicola sp.]GFH99798.1 3-oxoacyl-[acyl-carrier-protein] reductase FabG [Bacteroidaceae bacterium]
MSIIDKIKSKLNYKEVTPLYMDDQLRNAYQTTSVVGGCLKGRTALITGATSGIGLAVAERLLNEGCRVIISGRNPQKLEMAQAELKRRAYIVDEGSLHTLLLDQYNTIAVQKAINELFASVPVSIVINNAGIFGEKDHRCAFRSVTEEEYFHTVDVNLKSTILISELTAAHMAKGEGGNILNISSICGFSRNHYYTPYGISKTGIVRFTEQLSAIYKDKGVIINSVAPGSVATVMNHRKANDNIAGFHPLNHIIIPEQIAAFVAFMIGETGKYQTGSVKKACATEYV